jgi:hypothetical protein
LLADLLNAFDAALDWPVDSPLLADDQPANGMSGRMDGHRVEDPSQDD